ncbi:MAG: DHH family phosphoesterase [Candidatus Aminicenantales bacterium]
MNSLLSVLAPDRPVWIVVHNNPDPDSLASALGLQYGLKKKGYRSVKIGYDGMIGRAENKAMLKILKIHLFRTRNARSLRRAQIVLLDAQPGAGNVTLPEGAKPVAVIDHHPLRRWTKRVPFYDVRPDSGACSSIIYEYLRNEPLSLPWTIATALFYGIYSETQSLGREGGPADQKAYLELLPRVRFRSLYRILYPELSREFVANLLRVLAGSFYYKNLVGVVLDELPYPDFVAEMADFLLRIKNMSWSICLGTYGDVLHISLRSRQLRAQAGKLLRKIIPATGTAGGHDLMAGAQVRVEGKERDKVQAMKREILSKILFELNRGEVKTLFNLVSGEEYPFLGTS